MNLNDVYSGNEGIPIDPVYRMVDTTGWLCATDIHILCDIPLKTFNNSWTIGLQATVGLGYQANLKLAEGLSNFIRFDFPQYFYIRYEETIGLLLGYKYTFTAIPTQFFIVAFDIFEDSDYCYRIYATPVANKLYTYLSNGEFYPSIKFREFGVVLICHF